MDAWLLDIWNQLPEGTSFLAFVCLVACLEGIVGIGLILPGSTLVVLSGFLAFHGKADFLALIGWSSAGALLGDLTSYWMGARYGSLLWDRGFLSRRKDLVRKAEIFFIEHGAKSIFFGRFLGPIRGLVPFVAGASKMRPKPFLAYALVSAMLWGLSYPGLGYLGGTSWQRAQTWVGRFGILIALLLVVTILIGCLRKHFLGSTRP
jgi:undecaprenyl-diphosphatase